MRRRRRAAGDIRLRHLEAGAAISVEEPASASERVRVGRGVQLHHRVRRRIGRSVARLGRAQQTSGSHAVCWGTVNRGTTRYTTNQPIPSVEPVFLVEAGLLLAFHLRVTQPGSRLGS